MNQFKGQPEFNELDELPTCTADIGKDAISPLYCGEFEVGKQVDCTQLHRVEPVNSVVIYIQLYIYTYVLSLLATIVKIEFSHYGSIEHQEFLLQFLNMPFIYIGVYVVPYKFNNL